MRCEAKEDFVHDAGMPFIYGTLLVPVEAADNINLQAGFIDVYATGRFSLDIPAGEIKAAKAVSH